MTFLGTYLLFKVITLLVDYWIYTRVTSFQLIFFFLRNGSILENDGDDDMEDEIFGNPAKVSRFSLVYSDVISSKEMGNSFHVFVWIFDKYYAGCLWQANN